MAHQSHLRSDDYMDRDDRTRRLLLGAVESPCPDRRQQLREEAVDLNWAMALGVVRCYHGRGIEDDDIDQVALLGLWKAVLGYSPTRPATFAAYAIPTIQGEVKRHFRDRGWLVRPTRSVQENSLALTQARSALRHRLGREPHDQDLVDYLGISRDDIGRARQAQRAYHGVSLDAPQEGTTRSLAETLPDPDQLFDHIDTTQTLRWAIDQLPDRDRQLLRLRYGMSLTQSDIAGHLGVSQMQVSRLLTRIHRRLRNSLSLQAS